MEGLWSFLIKVKTVSLNLVMKLTGMLNIFFCIFCTLTIRFKEKGSCKIWLAIRYHFLYFNFVRYIYFCGIKMWS